MCNANWDPTKCPDSRLARCPFQGCGLISIEDIPFLQKVSSIARCSDFRESTLRGSTASVIHISDETHVIKICITQGFSNIPVVVVFDSEV